MSFYLIFLSLLQAINVTAQVSGPITITKTLRGHHNHHRTVTVTDTDTVESTSFETLTAFVTAPTAASTALNGPDGALPTIVSSSTCSSSSFNSIISSGRTYTSTTTVTDVTTRSSSQLAVTTTSITSSSNTPTATPTINPAAQACYAGGACGDLLTRVGGCFEQQTPWTDPYDTTKNTAYQACLCVTSAQNPFTEKNILYQTLTACARCLLNAKAAKVGFMAVELQRVDSFCRAQEPIAYLFLRQWGDWLDTASMGAVLAQPTVTNAVEGVTAMASAFTTLPPLANLAYGASAASDGSLAGVTPRLTTFTTSSEGGAATVTRLVDWVPTNSKSTFDSASASRTAAAAASSELAGGICMGRGPCSTSAATAVVPSWVILWISLSFAGIVADMGLNWGLQIHLIR